jgi:disulfide bond formation protein DsbB
MEMSFYSLILSVGILAMLTLTLVSMFAYVFSEKVRKHLNNQDYFLYMKAIGVIAISATTFAMIYQIHYELLVCILCWWQRIFIFPIDIVVIVSLWKRIKGNHLITGLLATGGLFFALYHYYYHFLAWVLDVSVILPCDQGGLLPACTSNE